MYRVALFVVVVFGIGCGRDGSGLNEVLNCTGFATPFGAHGGYGMLYDRYTFNDWSVLATCEVASAGISSTGISMYKAGQNGSEDGACSLTFDMDSSSSGWFGFTSSDDHAAGQYNDSSSADNLRVFAMNCTTH